MQIELLLSIYKAVKQQQQVDKSFLINHSFSKMTDADKYCKRKSKLAGKKQTQGVNAEEAVFALSSSKVSSR